MSRPARRLATSLLIVGLVGSVSACGLDEGATGPFTPVEPGVLTVATELPAPGFWNAATADDVDGGFEYALAEALAARLGLSGVVIRSVPFADLVAGEVDDFDIALAQITDTAARREVVDFAPAYLRADFGALVVAGTDIADLADARELRWGAQAGTTELSFLDEVVLPAEVTSFASIDAGIEALDDGSIDALLLDTPTALARQHADERLDVVAQFASGQSLAPLVPLGSDDLDAISSAMRQLLADGTVDRLRAAELDPVLGRDPADVVFITAREPK